MSPLSYKHTVPERLSSQFNNIWNQGDFENPNFPALYWSTKNSEKMCFPLGNEEFKPTGNSAHSTEFFTLRKFDLLYFTQADNLGNEGSSGTSLHLKMIPW